MVHAHQNSTFILYFLSLYLSLTLTFLKNYILHSFRGLEFYFSFCEIDLYALVFEKNFFSYITLMQHLLSPSVGNTLFSAPISLRSILLWGYIFLALWSRAHQAKLLNSKSCLAESSQNKSLYPSLHSVPLSVLAIFNVCRHCRNLSALRCVANTTACFLAHHLPFSFAHPFLQCKASHLLPALLIRVCMQRCDASPCLLTCVSGLNRVYYLIQLPHSVCFVKMGHPLQLPRFGVGICSFFTFLNHDLHRAPV